MAPGHRTTKPAPPIRASDPQAVRLGVVTLLTVARFPLILLFFGLALLHCFRPSGWVFVGACISLAASAITDLFDGYLARRYGVETTFGAHADPLMDKFFFLTTLPLLIFIAAINHAVPHHAIILLLMTLMFLTRDQWVTFLRSIGSLYQVSGGAHWSGKIRTAINFPLIGAIYYFEAAPEGYDFIPPKLLYTFEGIAMVVNAVSLYTYTRFYWPYLRRSASLHPNSRGGTAE